ncbi:hypothetical protein [Streptomyces sp. CBMA123]|uniref:hypothetical protein n=1 Tax=Streptomyces sp. CBMA123 TaxID=1896313 RepID=UPI001661B432|nr:hypothetical protein [Streptomyces sp. CBMA123]MBD0689916.1 hypothetical protein [Streptomyces sp. CBMA123]
MKRTIAGTLAAAALAALGALLLGGPAVADTGEYVHQNAWAGSPFRAHPVGPDGIEWPDD